MQLKTPKAEITHQDTKTQGKEEEEWKYGGGGRD